MGTFDNAKKNFEQACEVAGEKIDKTVKTTGDKLNDAAAVAEEKLSEGISKAASKIDDVTENTALKNFGDKVGFEGRHVAEKLGRASHDSLEDQNPAGE